MPCYRSVVAASFVLCVSLLIGCARHNIKPDEQQDIIESTTTQDTAADTSFVYIPNPFPQDQSLVPKAAVQAFVPIKALMIKQEWLEAETQLQAMVDLYPELSGIYVNLALVHLAKGEYADAERAASFALTKNPHNFDAYTALGVALREQGKFSEAADNYQQALALWVHHGASQRNLGIVFDLYMGKWEQALVHYKIAQQLAGGEDRELKGWIVDLERRIAERGPIADVATDVKDTTESNDTAPDEVAPDAAPDGGASNASEPE